MESKNRGEVVSTRSSRGESSRHSVFMARSRTRANYGEIFSRRTTEYFSIIWSNSNGELTSYIFYVLRSQIASSFIRTLFNDPPADVSNDCLLIFQTIYRSFSSNFMRQFAFPPVMITSFDQLTWMNVFYFSSFYWINVIFSGELIARIS